MSQISNSNKVTMIPMIITTTREALDNVFRNSLENDKCYTPSPKSINSIKRPNSGTKSLTSFFQKDNKSLDNKNNSNELNSSKKQLRAQLSQSMQPLLSKLQTRLTRNNETSHQKVSPPPTKIEIKNFNEIISNTNNKIKEKHNSIFSSNPTNNNTIQLLTNQALNEGLKSNSQQLYQLATFDRVLKLVEDNPNRFDKFSNDNKYTHYVKDENGNKFKRPIDAINYLCSRIEHDLKNNSKLESNLKLESEVKKPDLISTNTARDLGALMTLLMKECSVEKNSLKGQDEFPKIGKPLWDVPRDGMTKMKNWMTPINKISNEFAKIEPNNKNSSEFSTTYCGPSLTVWHTARFLEGLGATPEETKAYVTAQVSDWANNSTNTPEYNEEFVGEKNSHKYSGFLQSRIGGGAHSPFEGFMTFAHGIGLEDTINKENSKITSKEPKTKNEYLNKDESTAKQTLMRLILETNGKLYDSVKQKNNEKLEVKEPTIKNNFESKLSLDMKIIDEVNDPIDTTGKIFDTALILLDEFDTQSNNQEINNLSNSKKIETQSNNKKEEITKSQNTSKKEEIIETQNTNKKEEINE